MQDDLIEKVEIPKDSFDIINDLIPEEPKVPDIVENDEILINYVKNHIIWNQNEVNIDEIFAYNLTMNVMSANEDQELMIIEDCRQRNDWPKMKICKEA